MKMWKDNKPDWWHWQTKCELIPEYFKCKSAASSKNTGLGDFNLYHEDEMFQDVML